MLNFLKSTPEMTGGINQAAFLATATTGEYGKHGNPDAHPPPSSPSHLSMSLRFFSTIFRRLSFQSRPHFLRPLR